MSWLLYRWVWVVETPLHIGMSPAGMLNRTRLYVPARTLWGALTAQKARAQGDPANSSPDYKTVGQEIRQDFRFGYLFPAEEVGEEWKAWLPRYTETGLVWEREGNEGQGLEDRKFRMRLLSTRPGTSIDPETDTALEGSLREFEVINPFWRSEKGAHRVGLVGYVFVRQKPQFPSELFCGGDTRYGLGLIRRMKCVQATSFFDWQVDLKQENAVLFVNTREGGGPRVLAHVEADSIQLRGEYEVVGGWDEGRLQAASKLYWKPGSVKDGPVRCEIVQDGYWKGTRDE